MKKIFLVLWLLLGVVSFVTSSAQVHAQNSEPVRIEVFERLECPHCQAEKEFLADLQTQRDDIAVRFYELDEANNKQLWEELAELENLPRVTPITLIGTTIVQGFGQPETTGRVFEDLIEQAKSQPRYSFAEYIAAGGTGSIHTVTGGDCDDDELCGTAAYDSSPLYVAIPFIGSIDVKQYSLPILSIVLGFVDGFNPCAMWVLVTFLIVLAQVGSRRRMWQVAGLFIAAEAIMYYLILNVWFTAWDFVGLDNIITPIVGLIAIGGGVFFLYEWKTSDGTCKVTNMQQRAKISTRIKEFVSKPLTWASTIGIIGLAFSVNIIEFACSVGIPQAFTKIVELNALSFWETQWYMALYILFYMIDDFIVFGIALYSFEKIGLTSKYSRWSNLVGGILMIVLGLILIFKRQWLVL